MIETIPKDLEQAHTSIVEGIPIISVFIKSNSDLLIFILSVLPSLLIFMFSSLSVVPKLIALGGSAVTGIILVTAKIPSKIKDMLTLKRSLKQTAYTSKDIDEYLPVKDIKKDTLILKDGRHVRVLEANGLNLHLYEEKHQDNIIEAYRTLLNSLTFPLQIISKTEPININNWLLTLDKRVSKKNTIYKGFRQFIVDYIKKNKLKRRRYLIVFHGEQQETSFLSILLGKISSASAKVYEDLDNKEAVISNMCKHFGVKTKRLGTTQLTNLLMSYYNEESNNHEEYLSPIIYSTEEYHVNNN